MTDLRREQRQLLSFEKQIAGLAAMVAAGGATAKAADGKLHANDALAAHAEIQQAVLNLAEVTARAHDALEAKAVAAGASYFEAVGGLPKSSIAQRVLSILGLG